MGAATQSEEALQAQMQSEAFETRCKAWCAWYADYFDEARCTQLRKRINNLLYQYPVLASSASTIDDYVQDTLIGGLKTVLRGTYVYQPGKPFIAFLYGIAKNVIRNDHRRTKGGALEAFYELGPDDMEYQRFLVDERVSLEKEVEDRDLLLKAQTFMENHPDMRMGAIWNGYLQGKSVQQIAAETGLQAGNVRTLKSRLLAMLRKQLGFQ